MQRETVVKDIRVPEDSNISNAHLPLYIELKSYIDGHILGLADLARKVSISKPTLWRWANLKNKNAPNAYNVLELMKFFTKENNIADIIKNSGKEASKYLKNSLNGELNISGPANINNGTNKILEDFYCYFIFILTNTEKKMTRNCVKKSIAAYSLEQLSLSIEDDDLTDDLLINIGYIADFKINELIKNRILSEENGFLTCLFPNHKIKISITKKHLPKLFVFFKEKNLYKRTNLMYAYNQSLLPSTIKKVIQIQYDAFLECYNLMEEEKHKDGESYILATFCDSLGVN